MIEMITRGLKYLVPMDIRRSQRVPQDSNIHYDRLDTEALDTALNISRFSSFCI
jgi:hypothetical protein